MLNPYFGENGRELKITRDKAIKTLKNKHCARLLILLKSTIISIVSNQTKRVLTIVIFRRIYFLGGNKL